MDHRRKSALSAIFLGAKAPLEIARVSKSVSQSVSPFPKNLQLTVLYGPASSLRVP